MRCCGPDSDLSKMSRAIPYNNIRIRTVLSLNYRTKAPDASVPLLALFQHWTCPHFTVREGGYIRLFLLSSQYLPILNDKIPLRQGLL